MQGKQQKYLAVGTEHDGANALDMVEHEEEEDFFDDDDDDDEDGSLWSDAEGQRQGLTGENGEAQLGNEDAKRKKKKKRPSSSPRNGDVEKGGLTRSREIKTKHLDEKKKMTQMEIMLSEERMPTQVGYRRRLALGIMILFLAALVGLIVAEVVINTPGEKIVYQMQRSKARKGVFLLTFNSGGRAVRWNDTAVLESVGFASTAVKGLQHIPFRDFSIEAQNRVASGVVEIACLEESSTKLPATATPASSSSCPFKAIEDAVPGSRATGRQCVAGGVSGLKNLLRCSPEKLVPYVQDVMKRLGKGFALSSRCCDVDQVLPVPKDQAESSSVSVRFCRAPLAPSDGASRADVSQVFLRYFGKEDFKRCSLEVCSCSCFSDLAPSNAPGTLKCPGLPNEMQNDPAKTCKQLGALMTKDQNCAQLPALAKRYKMAFKSRGIKLGDNLRCYGKLQ